MIFGLALLSPPALFLYGTLSTLLLGNLPGGTHLVKGVKILKKYSTLWDLSEVQRLQYLGLYTEKEETSPFIELVLPPPYGPRFEGRWILREREGSILLRLKNTEKLSVGELQELGQMSRFNERRLKDKVLMHSLGLK